MPKQPDLIAAEMQGDATISDEVQAAASELYARRHEPAVQRALRAKVAEEEPAVRVAPASRAARRRWPFWG